MALPRDSTRYYDLSYNPGITPLLAEGLRINWKKQAVIIRFQMVLDQKIRIELSKNPDPAKQIGASEMFHKVKNSFIENEVNKRKELLGNLPQSIPKSEYEKRQLSNDIISFYVQWLVEKAAKKWLDYLVTCVDNAIAVASTHKYSIITSDRFRTVRAVPHLKRKENARTRNTNTNTNTNNNNNNAFQVVRAIDVIPYLNRNRNRYLIECSRLN